MKIKQSFVTNSSSTSFMVAFKKELKEGDLSYIIDTLKISKDKAEIILRDSLHQTPLRIPINKFTEKRLYALIGMIAVNEDYEGYNDFSPEELREFIQKNKGSYIYRYEFSDNDAEIYSELEHDDTFTLLPHLECSKH